MPATRRLKALLRLWRPRLRRANVSALRLFLRALLSEQRRVFALTLLIGVLCGLAAVAFHLSIRYAEGWLINRAMSAPDHSWVIWAVLTPTLGGSWAARSCSTSCPTRAAAASRRSKLLTRSGAADSRSPIRQSASS